MHARACALGLAWALWTFRINVRMCCVLMHGRVGVAALREVDGVETEHQRLCWSGQPRTLQSRRVPLQSVQSTDSRGDCLVHGSLEWMISASLMPSHARVELCLKVTKVLE